MRIFQVIESSTNASIKTNRTWYRNLYEPLVEMGHDVVLCPAEDGRQAMTFNDHNLRQKFSTRMAAFFNQEHKKKPFDMAFFYLMDGMFDSGVMDEFRKAGVVTCNFSCNNVHQFYLVEKIALLFDCNLYSEKTVFDKFIGIGAHALWWPMASNPNYFKPIPISRTVSASFVGARYANRLTEVYQLLLNDIDVHVYGPGWIGTPSIREILLNNLREVKLTLKSFCVDASQKAVDSAVRAENDLMQLVLKNFPNHFHEPVSDEELVALYSKSEISLGFLEVFENHDPTGRKLKHLHLRDFEAPMSGALYCTDYIEEMAEMFEPDKEVLLCRSQDERIEKIKYYLLHNEEADKIRQAARKRALAEHTYQKRFEMLFRALGLKK